MKHVVITGGAGFIGSHLCESFLERGYAVTAIDNFLTGCRENLFEADKHPEFEFIEANVSRPMDESKLGLLKKHGLFGVLHFACPASPVDFDKIPFEILEVDSLGTMNTVDLALRHNCRYLLASTSEVYGDPLEHPQRETYWGNVNTLGPRSCYDETKRFAEAYVHSAMAGKGTYQGKAFHPLNAAMVRIFNTYGPRMRPDDGRVVPALCTQGLRGEDLSIHGDGSQTRSFCFVTDLVDGVVKLFESDLREVVNIGNPVERSVADFAKTVQNLTGNRSKIANLPARPDDPRKRCPDISKAKNLLKWEPKVDLEEGLGKCLEFFKQHL